MQRFAVSEKKRDALRKKMKSAGIREKDLRERFVRSRGKGGQKVNKTSTCVHIKHIPTGIEVKCDSQRTQGLNRFMARRRLTQKIEDKVLGRISEEKKKEQKLRRQKRKRSKRAREKMLDDKKKRSRKKDLRRPVREDLVFGPASGS